MSFTDAFDTDDQSLLPCRLEAISLLRNAGQDQTAFGALSSLEVVEYRRYQRAHNYDGADLDRAMIFEETRLPGAFRISLQRIEDERGYFARSWCQDEFASHGLNARIAQSSVSFNTRKATLRGMHYQVAPHAEAKVVRCTRGAIYDVIVDMREKSPTYREWLAVELTADNAEMLYIPEGFAHGFETLEDDTEVEYQITEVYTPEAQRGLRYNDPALDIFWPLPVKVISPKDANWALLDSWIAAGKTLR